MRRPSLSSQAGLSLMELIVVAGVTGIITLVAAQLQSVITKSKSDSENISWMHELRLSAMRAIQDGVAWDKTVQHNANLNCLRTQTSCTGAGGPITLWQPTPPDQPDQVMPFIHNASGPANAGLNRAGQPCTGFDASTGNDACPFRFRISWTPRCHDRDTRCLYPQIELTGTLEYRPLTPDPILADRMKRYGFKVSKSEAGYAVRLSCTSFGGTWNAGTNRCEYLRPAECPPGQILKGFTRDGGLICRDMAAITCNPGYVLAGFDASGNPVCNMGCGMQLGEGARTSLGGNGGN